MNPGPVEEAGDTARSLIESLKSQPLTLALVVFNCFFMVLVVYVSAQTRASAERLIANMITQQEKTAQLLFNCAPVRSPGGTQQ